MPSFSFKLHESQQGTVVAACDPELLGQQFSEDDITLNITEGFYGGDDAEIDKIIAAAKRSMTTNFVGENLINALIAEELITEEEVHYVDGVPHVQLVFI